MDKEEISELKKTLVATSLNSYILNHPPIVLFYDREGFPVKKEYQLSDLAIELAINPKIIKKWVKTGRIRKKYVNILIRKGVLPKEWVEYV